MNTTFVRVLSILPAFFLMGLVAQANPTAKEAFDKCCVEHHNDTKACQKAQHNSKEVKAWTCPTGDHSKGNTSKTAPAKTNKNTSKAGKTVKEAGAGKLPTPSAEEYPEAAEDEGGEW